MKSYFQQKDFNYNFSQEIITIGKNFLSINQL